MKPGLVPEVQNRPVCLLLFGRGDPDLQIGLEMLHKIVTEITGNHILHGFADGLIVHSLINGFHIAALDKYFQRVQFLCFRLQGRFFAFVNFFQKFPVFPVQQLFNIRNTDSQFPIDGYFFQVVLDRLNSA